MKIRNIFLSLFIVVWIGMAMILLPTVVSNSRTYEAEDLLNRTGQILESDDASGGFYRFSTSNESGSVVFGPYIKIPRGEYFASFRLKTDAKLNSIPIATLDIFSLETGKINEMEIYTKDFKDINSYQSFILPFKSEGKGKFEFRVDKFIGENLWVDNITISPSDNFSIYKLAFVQIMEIIIFIIVGIIIIAIIRRSKMKIINSIEKYFRFPIKTEIYLFISILVVYTIVVLGLIGQVHAPTGDEPHYLITTHSIIKDGDVYLENNYLNKDYMIFCCSSFSIDPHISLDKYGRWFSSHGIGLSILLAVPYFLLGLFGTRLFMVFIAVLLVGNIFYLIKELTGNERIALMTCIFVSFTSPLLIYSRLILTETTAALILAYSTRILFKIYDQRPISKLSYLLCGMTIAYLPWLGIKYISIMIPLIILFLYYKRNITPYLAISSLFLYTIFLFNNFGSLSPFRRYGTIDDTYFSFLNLYPSKLATYFVDQQVGLIFYAPIYILGVIGLIIFIKNIKSKKQSDKFLILFLPSIFYFLMYVISKSVGGWCPPGRPLVAIIPLIAFLLSIGLSLFLTKRIQTNIDIMFILSLGIIFIFLNDPNTMFNNWFNTSLYTYGKSNLLLHITNSPFIDITKIFPSFLTRNSLDNWIYLLFWFGLFSIMVMIEYIYQLKKYETHIKVFR